MRLPSLLSAFRRPAPAEGLVYAPASEASPMAAAHAGAAIRIEGRGAPWIVVFDRIETITVAKWPGRLWRVRVAEAASGRDQAKAGGPPRADAGYVRAVAVRVVEELPAAMLFGAHGEAVARVIETASRLDRREAERLAAARHADAAGALDRLWRGWTTARGLVIPAGGGFDGVLKLGAARPASPVGDGLAVLHSALFARATAIDGEAATHEDEDGAWLNDPWRCAGAALADAALALGAPEHASERDRAALLHAFDGDGGTDHRAR
ncbi:MAG: hypothetical protein AB7L41_08320 [Flavobacteriaceae bacterium]